MIDEYMKKYQEQMDKITLSDTADQKILNDLLKAEARKGESYMKRPGKHLRAAMIAIVIIIVSSATAACGAVIHSIIVRSICLAQSLGMRCHFRESVCLHPRLFKETVMNRQNILIKLLVSHPVKSMNKF